MQRLIDANALIVSVLDHGVDHVQTDDLKEINQIIKDAPTIDAVSVVRCRECKFLHLKGSSLEKWCWNENSICYSEKVTNNWYCADGKRTVEFFHAHWVKEIDRHYHWHCSCCKHVVGVQRMECNFCPNCGAKMDGPETEEVSGDGEKVE